MIEIYTIGHGNRKIEDLIQLLKRNKIEMVIDVRSIPYSRYHPQFRQLNFKKNLENVGISYVWLGKELGGRPTNPALYKNGVADYSAIKETEVFKGGIETLLQLVTKKVKVTLMCSESDQNDCHRKNLITPDLIFRGIKVIHINKFGENELEKLNGENLLFD